MTRRQADLALLLATALVAAAEPCTQATAACMEPVRLATEGGFVNVYRSFPLAQPAFKP